MDCLPERKGKCNIVVVTSNPIPMGGGDEVVRWCTHCGVVVVDLDSDDRIYAGRIKEAQFPALAKENK